MKPYQKGATYFGILMTIVGVGEMFWLRWLIGVFMTLVVIAIIGGTRK